MEKHMSDTIGMRKVHKLKWEMRVASFHINFLVNSLEESFYLYFFDASYIEKTANFIAELLENARVHR